MNQQEARPLEIGCVESLDGVFVIWITSVPPMILPIPEWFTREEKDRFLDVTKEVYRDSAVRYLAEWELARQSG